MTLGIQTYIEHSNIFNGHVFNFDLDIKLKKLSAVQNKQSHLNRLTPFSESQLELSFIFSPQ